MYIFTFSLKVYILLTLLPTLLILLSSCSSTKDPLYAQGIIAGEAVAANMDSKIAKFALQPEQDEETNEKITKL